MRINILDSSTLGEDINLSLFDFPGEVKIYPTTLPDEIPGHCKDAEVLVLNKVKINSLTLPDPGDIRLICVTATGYDNVDLDYCREHNIALCNVSGYSTDSVAQVTLAMALYLSCHIKEYTRFVEDMSYTKSGIQNRLSPVFHELAGKRWGIVGCGGIGGKVASVTSAMGCEVVVCKRTKHELYPTVDIDTLAKTSDIISVHLPLNESTRNLINRDRIFSMKSTAIFINSARGAVADEEALCDAIESGAIGGIGIDVYSTEPFGENHPYTRIMHRDNVCLTPHMAWGAVESRIRCIEEVINNMNSFYNGEKRNRIV